MELVFLAAGLNIGLGLVGWIILGALAGALAGTLMRGGGYGLMGDVIVGILGALIGGFLLSLFHLSADGLIMTFVTALIGACILIAIVRAVGGKRAAV